MGSQYLQIAQQIGIKPNFWMSEEYFEKAGWVETERNGVIYIKDEDCFLMLPPIQIIPAQLIRRECWTDVEGYESKGPKFLDYEYLFKAANFQNMVGGSWTVFRKNSRKWPNRIGQGYVYRSITETDVELADVVISWLKQLGDEAIIYDQEVLIKYLRDGKNRKGLFTEDGKLRAINIWDENWLYTNYRYCICRPEPFLSEFARLLFYQDMYEQNSECIVNDGGVLDRISLKKFKDHMNPISVRKVYSWEGM